MVLLAAYTPHAPTPAPPPRVATVSTIPTPSEGLVCALQVQADQRTIAPTAGHGRLERMRGRHGQIACQSDGAFDRFNTHQATPPPVARSPDPMGWLAER